MSSSVYLRSELEFEHDQILVKETGTQVMMSWERPLMRRMAEIVCMRRGDVLEIGFGMGISCDEVQKLGPKSHTIVEAHPQIAARARLWAEAKPGVRIIEGRWQECLAELQKYDGISFDVFGGDGQREAFFSNLSTLLRPKGVATLWLADDTTMPQALEAVLRGQNFVHRMTKVSAIPDPRCNYSRSNSFSIPVITLRPGRSTP